MIEKKCDTCGKIFLAYPCNVTKYKSCSKECRYKRLGSILSKQRKGNYSKGYKFPKGHKGFRTEYPKGVHYSLKTEFKKGSTPWNKGKHYFVEENNPAWKGDRVGYYALHDWVTRKYGKANICENREHKILNFICSNISQNFQWANKSHDYKRDRNDWMQLCISCHTKYDQRNKKNK